MEGVKLEDLDKEVLPLLSLTAQPQVRCVAMQIFLGLTGTDDGKAFITSKPTYLEAVCCIARDDQPGIAKDAFFALINLATSEETAWKILTLSTPEDFPQALLRYVLITNSLYADIVSSLLSNLSRSERCAQRFVDVMVKEKETIGFDKVVEAFCRDGYNPKNNLHYLGPFLSNLTQIHEARHYVLDRERCVVQRLLPYTEYATSDVRRRGIVGVLHNCCFESDYHEWLIGDQVDLLPRLLLPLAGPEEFDDDDMERLPEDLQYLEPDKQREPDPDIRRMLAQAIFQLCSTKTCRLLIKEKNTYVIMRELHKWEKDPVTKLAVENLIGLLIGDEPEAGMENLREVEVPAEVRDKLEKARQEEEEEALRELKDMTVSDKEDKKSTDVEGER